MKYIAIIFSLLTISTFGQSTIDQRESERLKIEKQVSVNKDKLIVLVQMKGQIDLQNVTNKNWPKDIETTYNVLKNEQGQVIYIAEFPTSESGDWTLELKHFFARNGKLIAFQKRLSYFNEDCTDGAVVETTTELYDDNFRIIRTQKSLTDNNGKKLNENDCGDAYDWAIEKRNTVGELMKLKKIKM